MNLSPSTAEQRPHSYTRHGVTIEDPWHWLRDAGYPNVTDTDVLDYLKAENAYFDAWRSGHETLIDALFAEMKGRIKEDDRSVPIRDGDFLYWWAFTPGAQYRTWFRKPAAGGDDQILFDEAAEADGKEYFRLGRAGGQPGRQIAGDAGRRQWLRAVRADASATSRPARTWRLSAKSESASQCGPATARGIVFTEVNDQWRSYRARYHRLGALPEEAVDSLRGDRGARLFGRRRKVAGQEPDLHLDRRQCDQRSALRVRRPTLHSR